MKQQNKLPWHTWLYRRSFFKWIVSLGIGGSLLHPSASSALADPTDPTDSFDPKDPSDFTTPFISIDDYASFKKGNDWLPAVMHAQSLWAPSPTSGFSLYFGPTTYHFSGPIHLVRGMSIIGSGGTELGTGTVFKFDLSLDSSGNPTPTSGIICDAPKTAPSSTPGRGDGSLIERIALAGFFDPNASSNPYRGTVHGILMYSRAKVRDVHITQFHGDGVHVEGSVTSPAQTNANGWQLESVRIDLCGGNGVFAQGGDTNAGCAITVDCADNKGWGFYDNSFLGNTYIACQSDNNKTGSYASDNPNAYNLYLNCYSEGAFEGNPTGVSKVSYPSLILGGFFNNQGGGSWLTNRPLHQGPGTPSSGATFASGITASNQRTDQGKEAVYVCLGSESDTASAALKLCHSGRNDPYRLHYSYQQAGWWELVYANLDGGAVLRFSTDSASEGRSQLWFPSGYYVGGGTNRFLARVSSTIPSADSTLKTYSWNKGDRVFNADPILGDPINGYAGWICIQSGKPGVWKGYGLIQN
ncbi:MAG: hypothetical protein JO202_01940 [Ktedonobacteraceae bacterium]|nr:hypothetical protein [Ktedonobacteraceae bacterium]